jgi:hypothetical protein
VSPRYSRWLKRLHLPTELEVHERLLQWELEGEAQVRRALAIAREKVKIADIPAHRREAEYWSHALGYCRTRLQKIRQRIATLQRAGAAAPT